MGRLGDRDVIVSIGNCDGNIWVEEGGFDALAVDSDVLPSVADYGAAVRVWDQSGSRIGELFIGHRDEVVAVTVGRLGNHDVIVAASKGKVGIWDRHLLPVQDSITIGPDGAGPVTIGHFKGRDAIVLGYGATVLTLDERGNPIGTPLTGHAQGVFAVEPRPPRRSRRHHFRQRLV